MNTDPADQIDPALANPVEDGRNELVIIDSNMADKDTVLSQIGEGRDVLEIDPTQDAMSQIQDYLDAHSDTKYDAVHIMTHGNDLGFYLGSTKVTTADQMSVFNGHMAENGDFMLYGCELASNEHGQSLIQDIADFTGCDVAASTNTTGISGDWALEYNVGVIETANISIRNWDHNLKTWKIIDDNTSGKYDGENIGDITAGLASGDVIEFYSDITEYGITTITADNITVRSATVDGAQQSYTYTVAGSLTVDTGASITFTSSVSGISGNGIINVSGSLSLETATTAIVKLDGGALKITGATVSKVDAFGASSIDSSGVISSLTLNSGGTLNLSSGTVTGTVNRGTLTGAGAMFGTVTNYADFTLNSGSVSSLSNNGTFNMDGGTVSTLTNSASTAMTGGTITTVDNNSGTFDLTGGTVATLNNISDLTVSGGAIGTLNNRAGGDLAMSGGQITVTLNNSSTGTNEISGTAAVSYLNNSGTLTVSGGTVGTVTNSGTLDVSGGSISAGSNDTGITNNGTLTFSNTVDAGAISNRGTLNINGVLRIAAASGSVAVDNLGGTVNFAGGTLQNTSGAQTGTGIGNTAGGSVINGPGTIEGFAYGAEVLLGQSVAGLTFTNNTNNYLFPLRLSVTKGGVLSLPVKSERLMMPWRRFRQIPPVCFPLTLT